MNCSSSISILRKVGNGELDFNLEEIRNQKKQKMEMGNGTFLAKKSGVG